MGLSRAEIVEMVRDAVLAASTTFFEDRVEAYRAAIERESNPQARWALETLLENARVAEARGLPLCDDTGIPHVLLDVGQDAGVPGFLFSAIRQGVAEGLRALPGRPMGVRGQDAERISQSAGLFDDPAEVVPPGILVTESAGSAIRATVLMLGGGPEIRSRTYRIFHQRSADAVIEEVARWAAEVVGMLGCTPCIPSAGIGRTHFEAAGLMLQAMRDGDLRRQSPWERRITEVCNATGAGAIGLGGGASALGSFVKVGPQRASGVRIACMRPGCAVDPRRATVILAE